MKRARFEKADRDKTAHLGRSAGGHKDKCPAVVGDAAEWTVQILCDKGDLKD
jgi:hypothetical protein